MRYQVHIRIYNYFHSIASTHLIPDSIDEIWEGQWVQGNGVLDVIMDALYEE